MKLGILATHPIQYQAPFFRELVARDGVDLTVYYAHRPTPRQQGEGFSVAFDWDVDLLSGYTHRFLTNVSRHPARGFGGYDTPELAAIIARERFDAFIVQGWSNRSSWQAFRACWRTGTRLAVRSDSQLPQEPLNLPKTMRQAIKRLVYPHFIGRFDLCLPYGERSAEYFRHYGAQRIAVVPHVVDNDAFARQAALAVRDRHELRRQWGIPEDAICFLYCGKFIPEKNPLDLLRAIERCCSGQYRSVARPLYVLMAGDGPLRRQCESFALSRVLPVYFAGFLNQTRLTSAYVAVDCLVLPSSSETWGLVVNEAMASGVPAIVSQACGCAPELIEDGVTGYTYRAGHIEDLARVLTHVASMPGQLGAMGEAARVRIAQFAIPTAVDALLSSMGTRRD